MTKSSLTAVKIYFYRHLNFTVERGDCCAKFGATGRNWQGDGGETTTNRRYCYRRGFLYIRPMACLKWRGQALARILTEMRLSAILARYVKQYPECKIPFA